MNRKNILSLLLFIIVLNSCGQSVKPHIGNNTNIKINDTFEIIIAHNFFKWYKKNYEAISKINMVKMNGTLPYSINYEQVDIFIKILKSSNLFSENFLDDKRKYFKKYDELFKKSQQNDGPAEGFESDLFLYSQDVNEILDGYKNSRFTTNKQNNNCLIEVEYKESFDLIFTINSQNQIESITSK